MPFEVDHARAYVCRHVFENTRAVLLVAHEEGDWVFACGGADHAEDEGATDWRVVGVGHLTARDASLHAVSDLPLGWEAERERADAAWTRRPIAE